MSSFSPFSSVMERVSTFMSSINITGNNCSCNLRYTWKFVLHLNHALFRNTEKKRAGIKWRDLKEIPDWGVTQNVYTKSRFRSFCNLSLKKNEQLVLILKNFLKLKSSDSKMLMHATVVNLMLQVKKPEIVKTLVLSFKQHNMWCIGRLGTICLI